MTSDESVPLLCHRCGTIVRAGQGEFYVVRIEAMADPSPPVIDDQDPEADFTAEMNALIEGMKARSEQELMDQVYRKLTVILCNRCYKSWIENPTG